MSKAKYFEVDFPESVQKKINSIQQCKMVMDLLSCPQFDVSKGILYSNEYFLVAGDLSMWDSVLERLFSCGFQSNVPTLFISECALVYLKKPKSDAILNWISTEMECAMFADYSQILPNDVFGRVMVKNLRVHFN